MVRACLNDFVGQIALRLGNGVQNRGAETDIYSRGVGKNLVLELVWKADSASVQKDVCDLMGKNRGYCLWGEAVLRL
jgi:hypothetical protein